MKRKAITISMIMLLLIFAVMVPLVSVPTVSASTLKTTFEEWCCDSYPSDIYTLIENVPPEYIPLDYQNLPSQYLPYNPLDYLIFVGYHKGDISTIVISFIDPHCWEQNKYLHSHVLHWEFDEILAFDDDKDGVFDDGWVTVWLKGVTGKSVPFTYESESFTLESWSCEGRVTHASPDKTNYIGCKVGGKGTATWVAEGSPPSHNLRCPWGIPAWGYSEGTTHISGSQ